MKLPKYRVRRNPRGRSAWRDSSSLVLSAAGLATGAWMVLPNEQKAEILASLGISPYHLSLVSLIVVVAAGLIAKHTSVQRVETDRSEEP